MCVGIISLTCGATDVRKNLTCALGAKYGFKACKHWMDHGMCEVDDGMCEVVDEIFTPHPINAECCSHLTVH